MKNRKFESEETVFSRRSVVVGGVQASALTLLLGRLYQLQVAQAEKYETLAEANRVSVRPVAAPRGRIIDRAGMVLAENDRKLIVELVPEEAGDLNQTIDNLAVLLELNDRQRREIERRVRRKPKFQAVTIAENVEWEKFARLNLQLPFLNGVYPRVGEQRVYRYGADVAHLLGYVGAKTRDDLQQYGNIAADTVGRSGIEKHFEAALRGEAGVRRLEVNAYGRTVRELAYDPGQNGDDIKLTLDAKLQSFATARLEGHSGSIVIMDVENGDLLAMASTPSFDPNKFSLGIDARSWNTMLSHERKPLVNKALRGLYAPGSTFKMLVALAALENNIVDKNFKVTCTGRYHFANETYHCWRYDGHGETNLIQAIEQSCDSYFYDLALRTGIDNIQAMAEKFGLGQVTGLDLGGEKRGIVPGRDWKRANYETSWRSGETAITGIGQGYLLTTPLQLACMTATLANGGKRVIPRVTRNGTPPEVVDIGLDPDNLKLIQRALYAAVNAPDGTAYASSLLVNGARMSGKTGTVQVRRISKAEREEGVIPNHKLDWHLRDHSLFTGYAPHNNPRYAIAVVVEHGGGGAKVAAPIARDVMVNLLSNPPVGWEDMVDEAQATAKPQGEAG